MSATTSSRHQLPWVATRAQALLVLAYSTGAAALAGVGAVHVQQYVTLLHVVPWIGPLFLANAAACAAIIVGLAFRPTRQLAALGGVVISALTLGGLVVSYGPGLFGAPLHVPWVAVSRSTASAAGRRPSGTVSVVGGGRGRIGRSCSGFAVLDGVARLR